MSRARKLGFDPHENGSFRDTYGWAVVPDPTDVERVELAIAALTHGTDREVPNIDANEVDRPDAWMTDTLYQLAGLRAALAHHPVEEREIAALASELCPAWKGTPTGDDITRKAYELGARAKGGDVSE